MDSTGLGKRIKEARIAKKMTQSEVVGDFITRNMLSQIEGGTATPSIRTLEYLCGVLDIQGNQLMVECAEDEMSLLLEAKKLLCAQEFSRVQALCETHPEELSDEFQAILAQALLGRARETEKLGDYKEAAALAEKSAEYAQKGIYANSALKTEALMFLNGVAEKLSSYYLKKFEELREEIQE